MKTILILTSLLFVLGSCVKNNPDPSWIEVTAWDLVVNPNSPLTGNENYPGVLTQDFSNAWVYVENDLIGVFELPFKIPVLYEGDVELKIYPAVLNNGISATKKIYPFVAPYTINTTLVKNEVLTINPSTHYYEEVKFFVEDFEDGGGVLIADGNSSLASLERISAGPLLDPSVTQGNFGRITLTETEDLYVGSTIFNNGTLNMDLPSGTEVYLEIDYHNTNSLVTGVIAVDGSTSTDNPNVRINGQDASTIRWKKIYIDLRDIVSGSPNADYFEFSFNALLDEGTTGEINIDNIKAVYF